MSAIAKPPRPRPSSQPIVDIRPTKSPTAHRSPAELALASRQYGRGSKVPTKSVKDKKLRANLKSLEKRYKDAAVLAKDAELLRPESAPGYIEAEGELERTWKVSQREIVDAVDVATAGKGFELDLAFGPYAADYTRDGRSLLIAGRKGHVATFDWREGKLATEIQLGETVRDACWLHNEQFFAVSQKKWTYIYDSQGVEIHCLKKHIEVEYMKFLPYHFLLATVGMAGWLKYQDTSTGTMVTEMPTKLGKPSAMALNRRNAVVHIGHSNGTVTLWTPNVHEPVVKLLAHRGPVRAIAVDRGGYRMATAGADGRLNIFDIRNTYKETHSYFSPLPAACLDISDTGLLGVGWGTHVSVWKDALKQKQKSPYLTHHQEASPISALRFCPFDDVLAAGHERGLASLIIPSSGEPNFDAFEANPYATKKQRQEAEVRQLLEKLRPEMISLDPNFIGKVDTNRRTAMDAREEKEEREKKIKESEEKDEKFKTRGRNSAIRRLLRKKAGRNVRDERREKLQEIQERQKKRRKGEEEKALPLALERFRKKKR